LVLYVVVKLCGFEPGSVLSAFSQTLGYLLAWRVVLRLVEAASDELRPKYSEFIENKVSFLAVLWIRDNFPRSRIRIFSIPDPNFSIPDPGSEFFPSRIRIFSILNPGSA
jgi:hypothetical protein